ncbi:MAG: T9SS type A sorting domain-containing protein [Candidatus Cloacimonetes bacterium]|nr:T9SS type A sorting domain-containing protein [Candidatus Cloacimonadota bacterium]MBL7086929.1 T9SS type A sorting domain-containing protein [Candidatus Cloacimonadota bacterium]
MKKKYFLIILILILFYSFCYAQDYWETIFSSGSSINCIVKNSIGYLFAGTTSNGLYRSVDNGVNWEQTSFDECCATIISNSDTLYAGNHLGIFISTDNGTSWTQTGYTSNSHIISIDSNDNIFVGFWGGICKSSDNGASWELVLSFSNCEVTNTIVENSEGILFAGTTHFLGGGGVYRSTDQGDNWEHIGLEYEYISSLAINSNDEIFAGSRGQHYEYGGGVFRSSDNGETWTELCDDVLVTSIAINSEEKIFIGCSDLDGYNGAVHFSGDNGESWDLIESEIMPPTTGIEFITISEDDYIYAISYESINHIFRSVQSTVGIDDSSIQEITDIKLSNFPNPFTSYTRISYQLSHTVKEGVVEIYNIKGQLIKTLINNQTQKGGYYEIIWDGKDQHQNQVSSGVYLYRISAKGGSSSGGKSDDFISEMNKMILIK